MYETPQYGFNVVNCISVLIIFFQHLFIEWAFDNNFHLSYSTEECGDRF